MARPPVCIGNLTRTARLPGPSPGLAGQRTSWRNRMVMRSTIQVSSAAQDTAARMKTHSSDADGRLIYPRRHSPGALLPLGQHQLALLIVILLLIRLPLAHISLVLRRLSRRWLARWPGRHVVCCVSAGQLEVRGVG
jgi:hypothetical protein